MPRKTIDSDDDSVGDIPFKKPEFTKETMPKSKGAKGKGKVQAEPVEAVPVEGAEDDDEEVAEDEYAVESIESHLFEPNGTLKFEVKWVGYDKKHNTWEPEENLDGAQEELATYYEEIGGKPAFGTAKTRKSVTATEKPASKTSKPTTTTTGKKRAAEESPAADKPESRRGSRVQKKAKTEASTTNGESGTVTTKDGKTTFKLPKGSSWEDDINDIDGIQYDTNGSLQATVRWRNGNLSQHQLKVLYARCPQKMLKFYESHLKFTPTPVYAPGEDEDPETKKEDEAVSDAAMAGAHNLLESIGDGVEYAEEGIKGVASTVTKGVASMASAVKDAVTHNGTPKSATPKAVATKAGTPASAAVKSVKALKTVLNGEEEDKGDAMDTDEL